MAGRTLTPADADRHAAEIAEQGYTVVEDALDPELVARLRRDFDRLHEELDVRPGETAQPVHADDQLIPIPKPHPPTVCNTMWALTEFTDANATDDRRVGVAMNYCAGYIRQQENQQLGVPVALARTFPKRLQQLLGYAVYSGLIGHIDKQDPRKLLLEGDATPAGG